MPKTGGPGRGPRPKLYAMQQPQREIRAVHTASTVTVYQAYAPEIGGPAARAGRFPAAWKRDRMTWVIKPRSQTSQGASYATRGVVSLGLPERSQHGDRSLRGLARRGTGCVNPRARQVPTTE